MKLSGRLTICMVALALLTAAAVGGFSYVSVRNTLVPRALDRFDLQTALVAARLEAMMAGVRSGLEVERSAMALQGMVRAILADGTDPLAGGSLTDLRDRVVSRFVAELTANPIYAQLRIIGIADHGRELVRVDRDGPGGSIRVVAADELQQKGDRPYFTETLKLADGEIYTSAIDLNQEYGQIQEPHVPVLRIAAPIFVDGKAFGIVIANLDLRSLFDVIRNARASGTMVLVNGDGDYLVHPDRRREFGFDLGQRHRIQDDFSQFGDLPAADVTPSIHISRDGSPFGLGGSIVQLAGGSRVGVIQMVPYDEVLAAVKPMRNSIALATIVAGLVAAALGIFIARSMARPLEQMAKAVGGFVPGKDVSVPVKAVGEIGLLARQFEQMAAQVSAGSAEIRRQAEIFNIIMSSMSDMVMLYDERRRLIYANPAATQSLGLADYIGTDRWTEAFDVLPAGPGAQPMELEDRPITRAVAGERTEHPDMVYRRKDGGTFNVDISGHPIRDAEGRSRGAVMVVRDVTRARQAEGQLRQAQKLESVGQLTGGVAHDFNNILTVILGTSDLLIEATQLNPKLAKMAETIGVAALRGAQLTSQLLSFARKQALQPAHTDVNTVVGEVARLLKPTLGENVEIETALAAEAWHSLIDPSQLSTALLNLAVNARDAMPDGGKLTLETANVVLDAEYASAHSEVMPGDYVMVAFSDTGGGIPEEILNRVFEPFFTTKAEGKGTGLGLAMVYGFVKQSGGHIKIYSEVGHGTTVKLYLPRSVEAGQEQVPTPPDADPQGQETILLVEDDPLVRAYAAAVLSSLSYNVLEAANGPEAIALVEAGARFDLLFTDVIMPGGMNGRQLAAELSSRMPGIKILYSSGYTENAIVHHGRLDPGVDLLAKPYRKADLAGKLREVLARQT